MWQLRQTYVSANEKIIIPGQTDKSTDKNNNFYLIFGERSYQEGAKKDDFFNLSFLIEVFICNNKKF